MALYKLLGGTHTRGESGKKVAYKAGDLIDLSAKELPYLRSRVEPAAYPTPAAPEAVPPPKVEAKTEPESKPDPEPKAKSEPKTEPEPKAAEAPPAAYDFSDTLAGNAGVAQEALAQLTDPAAVEELARQEAAGKDRNGVRDAAEARLEELRAAGAES